MLQQLTAAQASPEIPINESFDTLGPFAVFGRKHAGESGLTWAYHGGDVWLPEPVGPQCRIMP